MVGPLVSSECSVQGCGFKPTFSPIFFFCFAILFFKAFLAVSVDKSLEALLGLGSVAIAPALHKCDHHNRDIEFSIVDTR